MATSNVVVIDNGTGFTKMGYAGNQEPTYIIPSLFADSNKKGTGAFADFDFQIGQAANDCDRRHYSPSHILKQGIVDDWDKMEKVWQHCIYKYLRIEPTEYGFLLTEPPANPPENREAAAEIMFETFGAKQMLIGVQGVLALSASWTSRKAKKLGLEGVDTGVVVDSGDGVTHVVPIADGYVIGNAIRHIPLAGRTITDYIRRRIEKRATGIPVNHQRVLAQRIKERYCYICKDIADEYNKFDDAPQEHFQTHVENIEGKDYSVDIGYEQFLGPEIFFSPDIFSTEHTTPLPQLIDDVIMACPFQVRKKLYRNIVLSGGTTMFRKFDSRLQLDLRAIVDKRLQEWADEGKTSGRVEYEVNVVSHERQRYAVWYGGSCVGSSPNFDRFAITKAQYEEHGAAIARKNSMV